MSEELEVSLSELSERYGELRLVSPEAERQMQHSLERYGQMSPVVVNRAPDGKLELIDGFKRLHAAGRIAGFERLRARVLQVGERGAKAAVLCLNWISKTTDDLEEAWVVRSLVRDDGLTQVEVSELLERDKSWVSRRLSLVERLSDEVQSQLRLGLLKSTVGRELARLPRGNQDRALQAIRQYRLGSRESAALVNLLLKSPPIEQERILSEPLVSLSSRTAPTAQRDLTLSESGNRVLRDLGWLRTVCRQVTVTLGMNQLTRLASDELVALYRPATQSMAAVRASLRTIEKLCATIDEVRHVTAGEPRGARASGRPAGQGRPFPTEDCPKSADQPQHGETDPEQGPAPTRGRASTPRPQEACSPTQQA